MTVDLISRAALVTCLLLPAGLARAQSGPDLKIGKSSSSTFRQRGSATYVLTVANAGDDDTSGAITLSDPMPAGLAVSLVNAPGGWNRLTTTATAVSCFPSTSIPAGQEAPTVTLTVAVAVDAPASVTSTATVRNDAESNTASNGGTAAANVAGIPTLSDSALLLVALMLGLAGVWALRPRG